MVRKLRFLGLIALIALSASAAFSQGSAGAITGTVSDASGALIPGVQVTATNQATNQTRQVITNETGSFRIDPLPSAVYSVSAELAGFRKEVRSDIKVDIDARLRIDFKLEVGAVTDVIEVTSTAPVVQTDSSSVGQVIDQRKIQDLPLNGRVLSALAYITPGAYAPRAGSNLAARGGFVTVGVPESANQFLMDGINNNSPRANELNVRINVDAVAEFKIQTQNYGAQYGRFSGSQVDAITKSGTNEIHGGAFGFHRNDNLDARNFFDVWPLPKKPEYKRWQYGGTIGGPIKRDKAFFFFGWQSQDLVQQRTTNPTIPLPEFWEGNLSRIATRPIMDPLTGQPFPGNIIPKSRIHPVALRYRPLFDRATLTENTTVRNARASQAEPEDYYQPTVKIDWSLSSNHQLIASLNSYIAKFKEYNYAGQPEIPGFMLYGELENHHITLQDVLTISPTVINEFRGGVTTSVRLRVAEERERNYNREVLGIVGTGGDFDSRVWGYARTTITGFSAVGVNPSFTENSSERAWSFIDILSVQKGNHALKFGFDWHRQGYIRADIFTRANGIMDFNGSTTGNAFADFLLGFPDTTERRLPLAPIGGKHTRASTNLFFQDDWKASSNLTLNLGLRYEPQGAYTQEDGKLATFDPTLGGGQGGIRVMKKALEHPELVAGIDYYKRLFPSLVFDYSENYHKPDNNNLAPRFGFAWTPGGRSNTVVRGGYGVFYNWTVLWYGAHFNQPPFSVAQAFVKADGPTWDNLWPGTGVGAIRTVNHNYNFVTPYYQHWNLGVQRELPFGIVIDTSYVGKKGTKILQSIDINQPLTPRGPKPYPLFASPLTVNSSDANSTYHGLQLRVERRAASGVTVLSSYAWGKMLSTGGIRDSYNRIIEKGPDTSDMRHRLSVSMLYQLPSFGNGVVRAVLGGWELSAISRANSGSPVTPTVSGDFSLRGSRRDRPNIIGNPDLGSAANAKTWWNKAAFALPESGTFGNAGVGSLVTPGYFATDFSIMKRFNLAENKDLQFRWEIFNVLNQTNLDAPAANFSAATFGTIGTALPSRQMQAALKFSF